MSASSSSYQLRSNSRVNESPDPTATLQPDVMAPKASAAEEEQRRLNEIHAATLRKMDQDFQANAATIAANLQALTDNAVAMNAARVAAIATHAQFINTAPPDPAEPREGTVKMIVPVILSTLAAATQRNVSTSTNATYAERATPARTISLVASPKISHQWLHQLASHSLSLSTILSLLAR